MISDNPGAIRPSSLNRSRRPFPTLPRSLSGQSIITDQFGRSETAPRGVFLPKNSWQSPQAQAEELRKAMEAMNKHGYDNHRVRPWREPRMQLVYGPPHVDRGPRGEGGLPRFEPSKPPRMQLVYGPPFIDRGDGGGSSPWNPSKPPRMQLVYGPPFIDRGQSEGIDISKFQPWKPIDSPRMQLVYGPPFINR